jgi:hypothetical protein
LELGQPLSLFSEDLWSLLSDPDLARKHNLTHMSGLTQPTGSVPLGSAQLDEGGHDGEEVWWRAHTAVLAEALVAHTRQALVDAHNLGARHGHRQVALAAQVLRRNPWAWLALTGGLGPSACAIPAYSPQHVEAVQARLKNGEVTVEFDEVRSSPGVTHDSTMLMPISSFNW